MYRKELQSLLSSPQFPNYFLIYGADDYQIELFGKEILFKFESDNVLDLYFDEYNFDTAKAHLEQASLFSDSNVLHVKSDKRIPAKELNALINLCEKSSVNAFIYEFYESDPKILLDTPKAFGSNFVRVFAPSDPREAAEILAIHANRLGVSVTKDALYSLYDLQNQNLNLCAAEINKIASLTQKIDESTIARYSNAFGALSFDLFFQKIIGLANIKNDFFVMIKDTNFDEIKLINALYSEFFRLFKIQSYVKINGKFDIKSAIGYLPPRHVVTMLQNQAMSLDENKYFEIFKLLNLLEFDLKTKPDLDKESFLLANLLELQEIIAKNRKN